MRKMSFMFSLVFATLGGFNGYLAVNAFMDGQIGLGMFSATASLWSYVCMAYHLFEGGNQ